MKKAKGNLTENVSNQGVSENVKNADDLEIVKRIKSGDRNAFDQIYNKYYPYIQYHCFLSVKDVHLSKDLTNEIFAKVYLNIDKYSTKYTFNTWVWSIARNHVVDHIRKIKSEPVNSNLNSVINSSESKDDDGIAKRSFTVDVASTDLNPEENLNKVRMQKMREKFIENLLSRMSERERMIIKYYYFDDMSYDEIADKLNICLNSMKVTLMRAKKKLKSKIGTMDSISHLLEL